MNKNKSKDEQTKSNQTIATDKGTSPMPPIMVNFISKDYDLKSAIEHFKDVAKSKFNFVYPICIPYYPESSAFAVVYVAEEDFIMDLVLEYGNAWSIKLAALLFSALEPSEDKQQDA